MEVTTDRPFLVLTTDGSLFNAEIMYNESNTINLLEDIIYNELIKTIMKYPSYVSKHGIFRVSGIYVQDPLAIMIPIGGVSTDHKLLPYDDIASRVISAINNGRNFKLYTGDSTESAVYFIYSNYNLIASTRSDINSVYRYAELDYNAVIYYDNNEYRSNLKPVAITLTLGSSILSGEDTPPPEMIVGDFVAFILRPELFNIKVIENPMGV